MSKEQLLRANAAFYEAFRRRDVSAMTELWAWKQPVTCIHPGWDLIEGRDQVIASWLAILASSDSPQIVCEDAIAYLAGDVGYVTCHEHIEDTVLTATNIFVLEDGNWKLAHHHASPTATARRARQRDPRGGANDLN